MEIKRGGKKYLYSEGDVVNGSKILEKTLYVNKDNTGANKSTPTKSYIVECLADGYIYSVIETNLKKGTKCPVCTSKVVLKGVNDVATTRPDLINYFVNQEEANTHTSGSNKKLKFKCQSCGVEKLMTCNTLAIKGFSCKTCHDGFSYPEKYMSEFLKQMNISYIPQLTSTTLSWCGKYRYDFYVPSHNCIIEVHGKQHYDGGFIRKNGRSLKEEQVNDFNKKNIAINNGITNYIQINCSESSGEYIKKSINSSQLINLFDVSNVNWDSCVDFAMTNLMKAVCGRWEVDKDITVKDLSEEFHVDTTTIRKYLNIGSDIGVCTYDSKQELIKARMSTGIKVSCDGNMFDTIAECSRFYGIKYSTMRNWLVEDINMPKEFYNKGLRIERSEEV